MELKGIFTALVTPFKDYKLDEEALKRIVEFQLTSGVDGLVPCGTTGEASTLSFEEHERVIELTIKHVGGKVPVIAGTGSNCTDEAIELTGSAKKIGADACLLTTPYYNKPTQEGLYRHFKKIAESVDIPLVLYNIPGRTGVNMTPETIKRLADIPNIIGIKEASGSLIQVAEIYRLTDGRFTILSGDDNLFLPMMSAGAVGVISVASNIIPTEMQALFKTFMVEKDIFKASDMNARLMPLFQSIFIETNPIPIKECLYFMGMIKEELRLPMCPASDTTKAILRKVLEEYGLVNRR
ncbi:MAG TPA: 4-hydroxy-tetrahydrodipicolinate synthase [Syntrophorhabdaceae bacterium]|jgi:4-hydroxy-tetrahydrodipicolinate synthase|nr:4-hydroxy-tetrahydrodipicolinate synthase [Syntrophorhabdaceae bacterium]MDI9560003.1 4-hydroxy-tetrahydrodipicolinate synthase [Pseudomonadota bacterium]MBP8699458.1 4-hydroxy-tetrahydrodipicolinate synthase [Syntrophorhabdaceae bacterium]MBV6506110.1 4-hydroxy-tetrahydrodipicolinate synthase [Syntrophorhabdaceae bacterium]HNQ64144.1 4-hydroxy-tetrahydrodipicolinate synthase [Syntrophorhabdaceae bacterium]